MIEEFRRSVLISLAGFGTILLILSFIIPSKDQRSEEKFKVVDHYGTCAVVRYTDRSNSWHYFLDCREVR